MNAASELDRVAARWESLAQSARSPIVQLAWARAWAETIGRRREVRVVEADGALAPLARYGPRWELLGEHDLYEPMDVVGDARALVAPLRVLRRPLLLRRVPLGSPLERLGRVTSAAATPVLALPWRPTGRRAADLRRAGRRAEEHGRIASELHAPAEREVDALLDEAYDVDARSWKRAEATDLVQDSERGAFYRRYAHASAALGELRVALLRIDGRAVAMQLVVERARRLWLLKIGFDESLARCSPGQLLLARTIADAATRGLEAVEFLGTAAPWTRLWTADERPYVTVRSYPVHPLSLSVLTTDATKAVVRLVSTVRR